VKPVRIGGARALVTGATGGLGQAMVRELARQGAHLVVSGRRADQLQALATEVGGRPVTADLAVRDDVNRLIEEAGEVDILVANAALPGSGAVLDFSPEDIDRALDVNLRAPIQMSRALGRQMVERGRGHIVLIGSLAGVAASPGSGIYSATKFGLRGFAHGLRQDLYGTGVGVSVILPGFVREAGMFADAGAKLPMGVGTVSPRQVIEAVVSAIQRNRAEVTVAPAFLRGGALVGGLLPGLAGRAQRMAGAQNTSAQLAAGQRSKR
jgi:short-subunit dehydrogenase